MLPVPAPGVHTLTFLLWASTWAVKIRRPIRKIATIGILFRNCLWFFSRSAPNLRFLSSPSTGEDKEPAPDLIRGGSDSCSLRQPHAGLPPSETVSQLSFRAKGEKSFLRM